MYDFLSIKPSAEWCLTLELKSDDDPPSPIQLSEIQEFCSKRFVVVKHLEREQNFTNSSNTYMEILKVWIRSFRPIFLLRWPTNLLENHRTIFYSTDELLSKYILVTWIFDVRHISILTFSIEYCNLFVNITFHFDFNSISLRKALFLFTLLFRRISISESWYSSIQIIYICPSLKSSQILMCGFGFL